MNSRLRLMAQPQFPIIAANESYFVQVIREAFPERSRVLGVLKQRVDGLFFDCTGVKWTLRITSDRARNTWLSRLLAETIYNPTIPVKFEWTAIGRYQLEELKGAICERLEKDDDVLTQFVEAKVIAGALDKTTSFEQIIGVLDKYIFEVDEEALWKEQG